MASAPFSTAAFAHSQSPAGASSSGHRTGGRAVARSASGIKFVVSVSIIRTSGNVPFNNEGVKGLLFGRDAGAASEGLSRPASDHAENVWRKTSEFLP